MTNIKTLIFLNQRIIFLNFLILILILSSIFFASIEFGLRIILTFENLFFLIFHFIIFSISANRIVVLWRHLKSLEFVFNDKINNTLILDSQLDFDKFIYEKLWINKVTRYTFYFQLLISMFFLGLVIWNFENLKYKTGMGLFSITIILSEIFTYNYFKNCRLSKDLK